MRSIEEVRRVTDRLAILAAREADRDECWWFADVIRTAASEDTSPLTGNQIGVLFAIDQAGKRAIQVTVETNNDTCVTDALAGIPAVGNEAALAWRHAHKYFDDSQQGFRSGLGTSLNPSDHSVRVYVGYMQGGSSDSLPSALFNPEFWRLAHEHTNSKAMMTMAESSGALIGAAKRFGECQSGALYYSIRAQPAANQFEEIARRFSPEYCIQLNRFYDRISLRSDEPIDWGWAIVLADTGALEYIKLEAAAAAGYPASLLADDGVVDSVSYRQVDRLATNAGLKLQLQTLALAIGRSGLRQSFYFRLQFPDEVRKSTARSRLYVHDPAPDLQTVIAKATDAILCSQKPDGSWRDFDVHPIGASNQWVTAYIGLKLAAHQRGASVDDALKCASVYLRSCWKNGLAYNPLSPPDANSTAHALLFWHLLGEPVSDNAVLDLLAFQLDNGAFGTFHADCASFPHSGTAAHSEVTATSIQVLWRLRRQRSIKKSIEKMVSRAFEWGARDWTACRRCFWWNLNWYVNLEWIKALYLANKDLPNALMPPNISNVPITSHLDAAYLLELNLLLGRINSASLIARFFAETQLSSGLWPAVPILRIVSGHCYEPWNQSRSQFTYADRGYYSGAAIINALSLLAQATGNSAHTKSL